MTFITKSKFPETFEKVNNPDKRLVLKDECLVQNSANSLKALNDVECEIFNTYIKVCCNACNADG